MEIVFVALWSGLFELSMVIFIVLANHAMQGEEERQRRLDHIEDAGMPVLPAAHRQAA